MKRLALLTALSLPLVCFAATPQEILTKRYKQYNSLILRGDARGMTAWLKDNCGTNFTYTSFQKTKFTRDGYVNGVLGQMAKTNQVLKSSTTVRSFQKSGQSIVATVASDFKGIVVFDTKKLILTDQSVTFETWVPVGKDWKLQKVVQVNADTQMHEEGGD